MVTQSKSIGSFAELLRKLYEEAGRGLWRPENKEYEEHNRAYIFQYMAVRLIEKEYPASNTSDYRRGYSTGYKAGKRKYNSSKAAPALPTEAQDE